MISFKGRDERLFQKNIINNYKKDIKNSRKFYIVGLLGLIPFIPSLLWLIKVKDNDFEAFQIAMVATIFSATLLTVPVYCFVSNYFSKKSYKFRVHKKDLEILVEEDLTFKVYVNGTFRYHIIQIEKISDKNISYTANISGTIQSSRYGLVGKCEFSKLIKNYAELSSYLYLNHSLFLQRKYQNNALKKVMNADENTRKKLFVQTLKESYFLLPSILSDKDIPNSFTNKMSKSIPLTSQALEGKICLYTSKEEIPKAIKKQFPIFLIYPLSKIMESMLENHSFVFKDELNNSIKGILINPYDEAVGITRQQLKEIYLG